MKKLNSLLFFAFVCTYTMSAQFGIKVGAGFTYGWDVEALGPRLNLHVDINEDFGGSVNYTYYVKKNADLSETNVNGHYKFIKSDDGSFTVHGLAGINIARTEVLSVSDIDLGWNVGAGTVFPITDHIVGFGEAKYTLGAFDQLAVSWGIMYDF